MINISTQPDRVSGGRIRLLVHVPRRRGFDRQCAQYQAPFVAPRAAPRAATTLRFVAGDFVARFRGRLVEAAPLRLADVRVFGLLIGEGQAGPFRVELELPRAG